MSQIVIISGPPGAGKSSVAEALCERYDRTVHLETDDLYGWIRMGFISPWKQGSSRQNHMVSRAAARAASAYAQEQYGVFIDGVIGARHLDVYLAELAGCGVPVHYVVLLPAAEEAMRRSRARDERLPEAEDVEMFRRVYSMFTQSGLPGLTLDNGALTIGGTADRIMEACGFGESLVYSPGTDR
jgi:chloramphenicol 3-O-phosphotransferase